MVTDGPYVYFADTGTHTVRRIDATSYQVTTVAGLVNSSGYVDGSGSAARFKGPTGLAISGSMLLVADNGNCRVRSIDLANGNMVATISGSSTCGNTDGTGTGASHSDMQSLATDGTTLWSAELYWNGARIRKITIGTGVVGQINTQQWAALLYTGGKLFASQNGAGIYTVDTGTGAQTRVAGGPNVWDTGCQDGTAFNARFGLIRAMDSDGTYLYAADTNCNAIRRIKLSDYSVTTISGSFSTPPRDLDGSLGTALFYAPTGLVITTQGTFVGNSYGIRLMH
jgi:hypothetical protein